MLKIRLARGGTKKRPFYQIVVADSRNPRDGKFIEKVGYFNPLLPKSKPERLSLESERITHWLKMGAQPTLRVAKFLGTANLAPIPEKRNNPIKALPKKKAKERDNPKIIDGSRKKRIASGSGTDIALVNKLLKQHKMMTGMMKRMSQGGGRNFGGLDGIPPELFNNLK